MNIESILLQDGNDCGSSKEQPYFAIDIEEALDELCEIIPRHKNFQGKIKVIDDDDMKKLSPNKYA